MTMDVIALSKQLIEKPSVTPDDHGCQAIIAARLAAIGCTTQTLNHNQVANLYAEHGSNGPTICFLGHTDVVPPGPQDDWHTDPFVATEKDDTLFGRGAADMKASVAAMVCAFEQFIQAYPDHPGTIALMLTSDEEGPAIDGTRFAIEQLALQGKTINYCIVGEPSCADKLGDTLRIGRRGSLSATITVQGKQTHIAYPAHGSNAVHHTAQLINTLLNETWDKGHPSFPETSFQVSSIESATHISNVIPSTVRFMCNFRYNPSVTAEELKQHMHNLLDASGYNVDINWHLSGEPFITEDEAFVQTVSTVINKHTGLNPTPSTAGGTSDGRFLAPHGAQVVEFGPCNASIHQANEHILLKDIITLQNIYHDMLYEILF